MFAAVLLWVALIAGLVPMSWFLVMFRPSWPIKSPSYLISLLVFTLWLSYVRIGAVLAVRGGIPRVDSWLDATISIVPLLLIDAVVIGLLASFLRYKAAWRAAMNAFNEEEQ